MSHSEERPKLTWMQSFTSASSVVVRHARKHVGVGLVCSVAYFDPGNWGVDLQAGSAHGYRLLFVVLVAGLIAVFLQVLAGRLGCLRAILANDMSTDLASHCRLLLHSHPKHPRLVRWLALYPLYALAEVAIISTDLAELLGSAMALCMLFPKLQVWQGVLITAADVLFLLALKDPLRGRPVRMFELGMGGLVLAVLICMCIIVSRVDVQWNRAFQGYLPSKYIFPNGAFYTSVGILGATVMPHSLFLGSALATQDRESSKPESSRQFPSRPSQLMAASSSSTLVSVQNANEATGPKARNPILSSMQTLYKRFCNITRPFRLVITRAFRTSESAIDDTIMHHYDRENNSFEFVSRHLYHGIVDMVGSLLGFAVIINSMILILSGAVFFYGSGASQGQSAAGLFNAYDLIQVLVGKGAATLFAIALLAAGQSSSIIATIAGQAVAEGFLRWRVSPVVRRLFTRIIAVIPSMAVAISLGRPGINILLVLSQVILSIVLPFITLPLIYLTSSKKFMTVKRVRPFHHRPSPQTTSEKERPGTHVPRNGSFNYDLSDEPIVLQTRTHDVLTNFSSQTTSFADHTQADYPTDHGMTSDTDIATIVNSPGTRSAAGAADVDVELRAHDSEVECIDYSSSLFTTFVACAVWLLIAAANVYVIVALAMGQDS
ncbi:natural resistance-associated macrophage protein [Gymnopus androsaceus JB14]|uniref:Natural resistance-associated macrophage protein n=1 Tax=Gymnopus androsaceus JB14 TaxID=1447944 RepID=A0A6A4I9I1_9AGAR|nr:natural resistance-associated macrophage protein [Gymnopus androsaceus JB14]